MPSISDCAWPLPVRFAEAMPSPAFSGFLDAIGFRQRLRRHEVARGVVGMGRQQLAELLQRPLDFARLEYSMARP